MNSRVRVPFACKSHARCFRPRTIPREPCRVSEAAGEAQGQLNTPERHTWVERMSLEQLVAKAKTKRTGRTHYFLRAPGADMAPVNANSVVMAAALLIPWRTA